jgi:hypothetical protein
MSKPSLAELLKDERSGGEVTPPGLSLSKILTDVKVELKDQLAHGSHEMVAALFNGSAFVMYPRTGNDGVDQKSEHGLHGPETKQPEIQQERDRGL